jgi:hypothetical protein
MMTNTAMQNLINEFGERINSFPMMDNKTLYIGYKDGPQVTDLTFETRGGVDFTIVPRKNLQGGHQLTYKSWVLTEAILGCVISDDAKWIIDPSRI